MRVGSEIPRVTRPTRASALQSGYLRDPSLPDVAPLSVPHIRKLIESSKKRFGEKSGMEYSRVTAYHSGILALI
jgi:hypothetical protein